MKANELRKIVELQSFTNPLMARAILNLIAPAPIKTVQTEYEIAIPKNLI